MQYYLSHMICLVIFSFGLSLLVAGTAAAQCGRAAGGAECPIGHCCSIYGYCGTSREYCGPEYCQSHYASGDVSHIITEAIFEKMLPHRNDNGCEARGFYTYNAFINAARRFPGFGTTGSLDIRKRELAAFFGQTPYETRGGWDDAPDGKYARGYCFIRDEFEEIIVITCQTGVAFLFSLLIMFMFIYKIRNKKFVNPYKYKA